jgi:septal ring factor EnvC (AmiA/AmiB activator)
MKKPIKGLDWLEQALRRMAAQRAANLARFEALDARLEGARERREDARARQAEVRNALYAEMMARRAGQPKPPRPRKRRPDEGGEPMPAIPRPKPKPLSGGAEAPIEREKRAKKTASQPLRVKGRPAKVPSEADRSPSL